MPSSENLSKPDRDFALDEFRGFTVFLMLFVNLPGSWSYQFSFLQHAKADGCYPADFIFPFFLWIVGFSSCLQKDSRGSNRPPYPKWLIRFTLLLLAGVFLNAFPKFEWESVRYMGVLQRIAFTSLLASLLLELVSPLSLVVVLGCLGFCSNLAIRLFFFSEGSDFRIGWFPLSLSGNLASQIDMFFLKNHIWKETKTLDPEGILSSLTALLSVGMGAFAGYLKTGYDKKPTSFHSKNFLILGFGFCLFGYLLTYLIPWNKTHWTLSFVFWTSGFAIFVYLVFSKVESKLAPSFNLFGRHAFFVFFWSGVIARTSIYADFRKVVFNFLIKETNQKELSSFLFTCIAVLCIFCLVKVYSGIWRILAIRFQAIFRFSSKVPK